MGEGTGAASREARNAGSEYSPFLCHCYKERSDKEESAVGPLNRSFLPPGMHIH